MRAFRWLWSASIVLATSLPYLIFWAQTPANHRYTWILPPYPEDSFGYMAWSEQAARGSILFRMKYTALPHAPFLFHPFFLICGWLSRALSLEIGVVHWIVKAIGVVIFFSVVYRYSDYLRLSRRQSILASILIGASSGLGGLFVAGRFLERWHAIPADLWMPEVSTFWSFLWNPLFPYSLTLILLVIFWLDRGTREAGAADIWRSGLALGVLALIHPYALPLLCAYAALLAFARRRAAATMTLLRFFAASLPFMLYVVSLSVLHPLVSRHSARGLMQSPSLLSYLLGFGAPFVIIAIAAAIDHGEILQRYWQLGAWFLMSLAFAYLPVWFQRKLIFGAQIPLALLAGVSLDLLWQRLSRARHRNWALGAVLALLLLLLFGTPVYQLLYARQEIRRNPSDAYYLPENTQQAFDFLRRHSAPSDVVFATWQTSRMIPAFAGNTVIWGHWAISVDLNERKQWNTQLFNGNQNWQDPLRSQEFWGSGIRYIFADGELKSSMEHNPAMWQVILQDADEVYANPSVTIYQHRDAGRP